MNHFLMALAATIGVTSCANLTARLGHSPPALRGPGSCAYFATLSDQQARSRLLRSPLRKSLRACEVVADETGADSEAMPQRRIVIRSENQDVILVIGSSQERHIEINGPWYVSADGLSVGSSIARVGLSNSDIFELDGFLFIISDRTCSAYRLNYVPEPTEIAELRSVSAVVARAGEVAVDQIILSDCYSRESSSRRPRSARQGSVSKDASAG